MIGSYLSVLRRRYKMILALVALLAPAALLALTAGSRTYESVAVVQTGSSTAAAVLGQSSGYEEPERRLATELEFFGSEVVAERAQERLAALGWDESAQELRERVEASPRGVTSLVDVVGTHSAPVRAQQLTDAFATAYIDYRGEFQRESLARILAELESQLQTAERDLAVLDTAADPSPAGQRAREAAAARYQSLTQLVEDARLRLSVDTGGVALLSPASEPELVEALPIPVAVVVAALGALFVAVGLALLVDLLRDPVRTRDEAHALLGAPVLGEFPRSGGSAAGQIPALFHPSTPYSAAARGIRLRVDGLFDGAPPSAVVITGAGSDAQDMVLVGVGLAAAWGRAGLRVALVVDPLRDDQTLSADGARAPMQVGSGVVCRGTALPGVWAAPATTGQADEVGLLDTPSPRRALSELQDVFDVVVLVEPGTDALDAAALSDAVDATLLVCALGRTPARRLRQLAVTLADYEARLDGMVLAVERAGRLGRGEPKSDSVPQLPAAEAASGRVSGADREPVTAEKPGSVSTSRT